jgi:hypothetical protein
MFKDEIIYNEDCIDGKKFSYIHTFVPGKRRVLRRVRVFNTHTRTRTPNTRE